MQLLNTLVALQTYLRTLQGRTIGLVPTMGALHAGHMSLIERSRQENDCVVVSIFVNPLQFGPSEDLDRYPRPAKADQALCEAAGVDVIFMPSPQELYGTPQPDFSNVTQVVPPPAMVNTLCGHSRPTHFQGVATVVTKLLNIVRPTRAYFGQKDAQQAAILKKLQFDLNLPGQIVVCPIVRESDGLALSSRNRYLIGVQRQQATVLNRSLRAAQSAFRRGERDASVLLKIARSVFDSEPNVELDYLALVHPDTLKPLQLIDSVGMMAIAGYVGPTPTTTISDTRARILDNVVLHNRKPIIAIDGPAGAGKSTVARQIAHQLDLLYLDTGAMYRALTWYVLQQNVDPADEVAVAKLLPKCDIQLIANVKDDSPQPPTVKVNGEDVTQAIRTAEVTLQVSTIAAQSAVRTKLVEQQQAYGMEGGVVADGRDIGTKVFPGAELKIYLTASVEERARRRYRDLEAVDSDKLPTLENLADTIAERDRKDSTRDVSPLKKADDAIELVTDDLSATQVIDKLTALYSQIGGPTSGLTLGQTSSSQTSSSQASSSQTSAY
ncbi:MAG: bifunctional pantoate--beta-alanine ligase/(d)CMP kinase [Phormidesmis sp.]